MIYKLSIGDIVIQLIMTHENMYLKIAPFIVNKEPDYLISIKYVKKINVIKSKPIFEMQHEKIYEIDTLRMIDGYHQEDIQYRIKINSHKTKYEIIIQGNDRSDELEYVLSEKVITDILARHTRFLIHGSAIEDSSKAIIFCGSSQIGKTTIAKTWLNEYTHSHFINDDKPLLTKEHDYISISGHPWAGSEGVSNKISVPLFAIIFIQRGLENQVIEIDNHEKIKLLMEHFKKSIDPIFTERLMYVIEDIIKSNIVIIYQSVNDKHTIHTLKQYLDNVNNNLRGMIHE